MIIIAKLAAVMLVIVLSLKKRFSLGNTMFGASAALLLLISPHWTTLQAAVWGTLSESNTWKLLLAMYLVMCLEHQLRMSGVLDGFMDAVRAVFSNRVLLAAAPALIGFLPSLGGAIMSCPMVQNSSRHFVLSSENKSTVNYWFRHVGLYANPIEPGVLLAGLVLNLPLREILAAVGPFAGLSFLLGWIFLIRPLRDNPAEAAGPARRARRPWRFIALAVGPIAANILLVVALNINAAVSLAMVIFGLALLLRQNAADVAAMFRGAYHFKLLWGVFGIVFFQHMFHTSGAAPQFLSYMETTAVPIDVVVMLLAFAAGFLCGSTQSMIAISFPIIVAMGTPDMRLAACVYVFGAAGQMITPVHLCYPITVAYFKADMIKPMLPVVGMEIIMMAAAFAALRAF